MISSELIIGGVGVISTFISGWVSFIFTKRKYNSEVDHTLIENMEKSLEFYQKLSDDNKLRLEEMRARNDELEKEVKELRSQLTLLSMDICKSLAISNPLVNKKFYTKRNGKAKDRLDQAEGPCRGGCKSSDGE